MIAVDHNRRILSNSIVRQRALNLGYKKGIVSPVSLGLVMVVALEVHTVVFCEGARFYCFGLLRMNRTGAHFSSREYTGHGGQ